MDFSLNQNIDTYGKDASCIPQVTRRPPNLSGEGVIIAVLDSGIDYFLPEFRDEQGRTRILGIWDQTARADADKGWNPPEGYAEGVLYTRAQIEEALGSENEQIGRSLVPTVDTSGHGTAVAAVAAGSRIGVAPKAELLIVKLGNPAPESFPRTTQLMRGINYAVNLGVALNRPMVINVSFGNTYGDHRGESLLERFLDNASEIGRTSIVVGSGNEGTSNGHTAGIAKETKRIELAVAAYETGLSVQLWTKYNDRFRIRIISPGGQEMTLEMNQIEVVRRTLEQTQLLCYVGEPLPYAVNQELFIDFIPQDSYINEGVWRFELTPVSVVTGEYRFYLPSYAVRNAGTGFFLPSPQATLTIPSTARRVITVGAYDARLQSYADFSGRGYVYYYQEGRSGGDTLSDTGNSFGGAGNFFGVASNSFGVAYEKPDLVAPGVDIAVPRPGGGYEQVSGTSFATPYVSGSAALLMEYGIVQGNDEYMYGEKLKAFLQTGARKLPAQEIVPSPMYGWGALCVEGSLPK